MPFFLSAVHLSLENGIIEHFAGNTQVPGNKELTADILLSSNQFIAYINDKLNKANARYGIGGYAEHRTVYSSSKVFDGNAPGEEPRRLHLGIDSAFEVSIARQHRSGHQIT